MIIRAGILQCAELEPTPELKARTILASYKSRIETCPYAYCYDRKLFGAFYEGEIRPLTIATDKYFFGEGPHTLMLSMNYPYFTDATGTIHIVGLEHCFLGATAYCKSIKTLKGLTYEEEVIKFTLGRQEITLQSRVYKDTTLTFAREPIPLRRL